MESKADAFPERLPVSGLWPRGHRFAFGLRYFRKAQGPAEGCADPHHKGQNGPSGNRRGGVQPKPVCHSA